RSRVGPLDAAQGLDSRAPAADRPDRRPAAAPPQPTPRARARDRRAEGAQQLRGVCTGAREGRARAPGAREPGSVPRTSRAGDLPRDHLGLAQPRAAAPHRVPGARGDLHAPRGAPAVRRGRRLPLRRLGRGRVPRGGERARGPGRGAGRARAEEGIAALAGEAAAETYGLAVLSPAINDEPGNLTRFVVLAAHDTARPTGDDKTSILFSVRDEVGILARMLKPFAAHGIDLIKIESRPLRGRPWEYVFYLDLKGHRRERRGQRGLAEGGRGPPALKGPCSVPRGRP